MSRRLAAVLAAASFLLAAAVPAHAAIVDVGSSTNTPWTTCAATLNQADCTVVGDRIPSTGRLTTVRIAHAAPPASSTITLKVKLLRVLSSGEYQLVRNIGDIATVAADSTSTTWSGLSENVTAGQYLAFFVDNQSLSSGQLTMATFDGGSGLTFYSGDVTTDTSAIWPYASYIGRGTNMSAVVRTPPVTTIDDGPSGWTQDRAPTFSYSADEGGVTFECRLDGGDYAPCPSSGYDAPTLTEATHTFYVRAVNDIGMTGAAATHTFTVDVTPPATSIDSGPNGIETSDTRPTFAFSSNEGATFECKLDGGPFLECPSPAQPAAELSDGQHTLQVRAVDYAGNIDPTPAVATFTVKRPAATTPTAEGAPPQAGAWAIPFSGRTWTFSDPADSRGGASTDIENVRLVYDAAGRLGVLLRFHGSGPRRVWVDLHRSPDCTDSSKELWISTQGDQYDIWATASMGASEFVGGRTSGDGRETLVVLEDARAAGLAFRCLHLRSVVGSDTVDELRTSLDAGAAAPPAMIASERQIVAMLRQSLTPLIRALSRRSGEQLGRKSVHKLHMPAPGPGSVGIEWRVSSRVAKRYGVRAKRGVKTVTLGVGARSVRGAAKKVGVNVKVTKAGKKVLRKGKRLKMQVRTGYLPQGSDKLLAATRSVRLK